MTSVSVLKVVVTSAEFASFKPFLMSLHMPLTQVMWSSGVLWLKVRDCIFVDATGVDSSFHFLPSGSILGNGYH